MDLLGTLRFFTPGPICRVLGFYYQQSEHCRVVILVFPFP